MDRAKAKARQGHQPPIKGSAEHLRAIMKTTAPAKPPPGFPPGTSVPKGITSEAMKLALESLPANVITENGQLMIALVSPGGVPANFDPRWEQPSAVVLRHRCFFCNTQDESNLPLQLCWHENTTTGVKCGKRFCFNSRKKCGSRVAYNIKPPSPSGLKDFPD
eukprot:224262-Amphidinium_carterae.2